MSVVFDGDLIRASLHGKGKKLFVSFRQRIDSPGEFDPHKPVTFFKGKGYAHLHIQSRWNDWFINAETRDFEQAIAPFCAGFERVVAMGFSMGGYGAMRFSRSLNLSKVLLVSSQFSVDPVRVPWERRYREWVADQDSALADVTTYANPQLNGFILYDPFVRPDVRQTKLITDAFANLQRIPFAGGGHPCTPTMMHGGRFRLLQRAVVENTMTSATILHTYKGLRRDSHRYWSQMASACEKRGHANWAKAMLARKNELIAAQSKE